MTFPQFDLWSVQVVQKTLDPDSPFILQERINKERFAEFKLEDYITWDDEPANDANCSRWLYRRASQESEDNRYKAITSEDESGDDRKSSD